ncbi:hypothetical protein [Actinoplanes sp. TBRC 11911]|uniref:hypothetical protein n=1 Tax=Actinoplanes sp. TBRC 11911 TaxID=2729386 RepID=UPI001B7D712B|nr:hypothetical protein [Actinoplanes sp. TBRC 11911]
MDEGYPSREDRIVAEFGDGHDVEGIALRYGLTVEQVYAVIEREVGPASQGPPVQYPPQGYYYAPPPPAPNYYYAPPPPGQVYYGPPAYQGPPPGYAPPGYAPPGYAPPPPGYAPPGYAPPPPLDEDAIVAEYGEGYDVEWIARKHGIAPEHVYEVVLRNVDKRDDPE